MVTAVTGGTGFLGAHTVAELLRRGERVRLLARDPDRVAGAIGALFGGAGGGAPASGRSPGCHGSPGDVEVVHGDLADPAALKRLLAGADALLHAAGVYTFDRRRRGELWQSNVDGTAAVLEAARRAGTGRIVHVSTVGALFPTTAPSIDAASPVAQPREAYLASKAAADTLARKYAAEGAPVVVTYPPALLGPHDPHVGDQNARLRDLLRGLMPIWPSGGLPIGDVRDSALLHADLLTGPAPAGSRFFGPGRFLRTAEYLAAVRAATGRRLPAVFLPARAMFGVGKAADALQRIWPWHIPAEYGALYVCATAVPAGPAAPTGGVPARPVAETVRDTVAWLHGAGLLTGRQAGTAAGAAPASTPAARGTGPTGKAL